MKKAICLAVTLWLVQTSWACAAASFQGLSDLGGGGNYSYAYAVSGDGSTVVGRSFDHLATFDPPRASEPRDQAFRWTENDAMIGLGYLPGGLVEHSVAYDVSYDGSVVVGTSTVEQPEGHPPEERPYYETNATQAFRWTANDGIMVGLGTFPVMDPILLYVSEGSGTSADGSIVVGTGTIIEYNPYIPHPSHPGYIYTLSGNEAFRWTNDPGMVGLGHLGAAWPSDYRTYHSVANDVSADGSTVVGYDYIAYFDPWDPSYHDEWTEAFIWTLTNPATGEGTKVGLGRPDGYDFSSAAAVSADGTTVVGNIRSAGQPQAFSWTSAGGFVGLGDPSDFSLAHAVSGDGSIVVGQKKRGANYQAFIWDESTGVQNLKDVLINDHGLGSELDGWTLIGARGISDDGTVIVGYGRNPNGKIEAYRASLAATQKVPEPSTLVLTAIAIVTLLVYAWRKRRKS